MTRIFTSLLFISFFLINSLSLRAQTVVTISTPYFQDFGVPGCTMPANWQNLGPEFWQFRNFSNTYMQGGDHTTGTTCFANIDDSGGGGNPVGNLISETFDLTALSAATLRFWWQNSNGTSSSPAPSGNPWMELRIDVSTNGGATYTNDILVLGNEQVGWAEATVDITPFISANTRIRFRGIETNSFRSDLSLDDVEVFQPPASDVGVTALNGPIGTCNTGIENIDVTIGNFGALPATNFDVTYIVDDPVLGVQPPVTELFFGPFLSPGQTTNFTFATPYDFSNGGTYNVTVITNYTLDQVTSNDTFFGTVFNPVAQPPYLQTFDSWPNGNAPYADGWIDGGAARQWTVDAAGTGSSGTGPSNDHTTGFGNYLYTETSGPAAGTEFHIISTCIDLSAIPCPKMRFWYHMYGSTMGELHVDVSTDDGVTWIDDVTPFLDGEQQTSNGAPWLDREVNLSQFQGQVIRVRFRGISGGSFRSDMAIDDFEIFDDATDDMAIMEILDPSNGCGLSDSTQVRVVVQNMTCLDQTDVAMSLTLNGGAPILDTIPGLFPAFTVDTFTFGTTVDLSTPAFYDLFAEVTIPNDANLANDTLGKRVESRFVPLDPTVSADTSCGPSSFTLIADTNSNTLTYWYDSMNATVPVMIGDTFVTPVLNTTTTYYASAVTGGTDSLGAPNPGIGQGGNYQFYPDGLEFDVFNEMVLEQVTVYTNDTGQVVINILDGNGNLIFTTTYNAVTRGQQDVPIKLTIPVGEGYQINAIGTNTGLYRNQTGGIYPYNLFGVASITGPINNLLPNYYFFYNWVVRYVFCESNRVPSTNVVEFAPVFDFGPDSIYCPGVEISLEPGYPGLPRVWSTGDTTNSILVDTVGTYSVVVTDTGAAGCDWTDTVMIDYFEGQDVDLGMDGASCGPALLDATVPGGSYLWSTGATTSTIIAIMDGEYSVMAIDSNGCESQDTIDVTILPLPMIDLGADTNACGGPVVLDTRNPSYTTLWSTGSTNSTLPVSTTGNYSVTVTDRNNCSASDSVNVSIGTVPFVFLGADVNSCQTAVNLDAGNPGSTYLWSNGMMSQIISAGASGSYWVEVTNSDGCSGTDTVVVNISSPTASAALGPDTSVCLSYVLNPGTNPGSSYLWSTGDTTQTLTVSTSGTYSVRIENVCETAIDAANVTVSGPPNASYTFVTSGSEATFTNTSATGDNLYDWNFGDGTFQQSNDIQTSPTHDFEWGGTYLVTLTVTNPCGVDVYTDSVTVDGPTRPVASIEDLLSENGVVVYPNPTEGIVNIEATSLDPVNGDLDILLIDAQGRIVSTETIEANELLGGHVLDLEGLAKGLYLIRLEADGQEFSQRVLLK